MIEILCWVGGGVVTIGACIAVSTMIFVDLKCK